MASGFVTFLDHVGSGILKVLGVATKVATAIEPEVDTALTLTGLGGLVSIFNNTVALAGAAQAATANATGTGAQKLAMVVSGITPEFETWLTTNNITMSNQQITDWTNLAVQLLLKIPAPVTSTTVAPTSTPAVAPPTGAAVK